MHPDVTHTDIEALIDGELNDETAKTLRVRILSDPQLRAKYESLCQQKALLKIWWSRFSKN